MFEIQNAYFSRFFVFFPNPGVPPAAAKKNEKLQLNYTLDGRLFRGRSFWIFLGSPKKIWIPPGVAQPDAASGWGPAGLIGKYPDETQKSPPFNPKLGPPRKAVLGSPRVVLGHFGSILGWSWATGGPCYRPPKPTQNGTQK